jgi:hypothetical protein
MGAPSYTYYIKRVLITKIFNDFCNSSTARVSAKFFDLLLKADFNKEKITSSLRK